MCYLQVERLTAQLDEAEQERANRPEVARDIHELEHARRQACLPLIGQLHLAVGLCLEYLHGLWATPFYTFSTHDCVTKVFESVSAQAEAKLRGVMADKAALTREVKEARAALEVTEQGREQVRRRLPNGLGSRTQHATDKVRPPCPPPIGLERVQPVGGTGFTHGTQISGCCSSWRCR